MQVAKFQRMLVPFLDVFGFLPGSLCPIDEGLSHIPDLEDGGGLDVIPVLTGKGINNLLLGTLLAGLETLEKRGK